jgi:hypothetical protein
MTELNRLCNYCMEDNCLPARTACRACGLSLSLRRSTNGSNVRPSDRQEWWGPTMSAINPEDILDGFTVEEA